MQTLSPPIWERLCRSEEETLALGRSIGRACEGGEVFLVQGELGAGKTCLANGIAQGLGIAEPAASPTFVLLRSYRGARGLAFHHSDFYRLANAAEAETIGLDDCQADDAVLYIEWPDRCPGAIEACTLWLNLESPDESTRRITARPGKLRVAYGLHNP